MYGNIALEMEVQKNLDATSLEENGRKALKRKVDFFMSMTVQEVLELPSMKGLSILAGKKGQNRLVRCVTVMDAPDALSWIRGNELIISSGYIYHNSVKEFEKFIRDVAKIGVAAVAFKTNRFLKEIPQKLIDLSNSLELPLIDIPDHFAFIDIIHPVLSEIVNRQARMLKYSETVRHSFFDLSVNGAELEMILKNLEDFTPKPFVFVDTIAGKRFFFGKSNMLVQQFENRSLREVIEAFPSRKVALNEKVYGYLVFDAENDELKESNYEIPITQARGAILLYMQRRIAEIQAESRYRNEFVQDLLMHNLRFEEEVWNRSSMFGWNLKGPQFVLIADIDNYKHQFEKAPSDKDILPILEGTKRRIYSICKTYIKSLYPNIPYADMSDSIAFILPYSDSFTDLKSNLSSIIRKMQCTIEEDTHFTVTVGIGNNRKSIFDCHKSYNEAKKSLETVRAAAGGNRLIFWKDLGVYKLLGNIYNTEVGHSFYKEYIGSIIEYDKKKKSEFLKTLKAMVRNNWQMKAAAKELSVHYSTFKYRYSKICSILDFDPGDSEQRLNIALSLKLYIMNQDHEIY